jgi:hypothetical protein
MRSAFMMAVLLLAAGVVRGDCIAKPRYVIEVQIRSCETAEGFNARQDPRWDPQSQIWMMKRSAGGIVIEGIVETKWLVTEWNGKAAKVDPPVWADEPGKWFVQPEAKLSCETVVLASV